MDHGHHGGQDRPMLLRAVEMAVWQRQGTAPLILHSDCGDNAACEGFFGVLKRERARRMRYPTLDSAKADLFDSIERFHNPRMRRRVARHDMKFSTVFKPSVKWGRTPLHDCSTLLALTFLHRVLVQVVCL